MFARGLGRSKDVWVPVVRLAGRRVVQWGNGSTDGTTILECVAPKAMRTGI
jgi:hypothetical protein